MRILKRFFFDIFFFQFPAIKHGKINALFSIFFKVRPKIDLHSGNYTLYFIIQREGVFIGQYYLAVRSCKPCKRGQNGNR